jgi:hypothetical protein
VQPVYNLSVEGDHPEYFANGILVHNCVWAFTVLMVLRRGAMVQGDSAEVASVEDEQMAHPAQTFSDSIVRDGAWFPRGQ